MSADSGRKLPVMLEVIRRCRYCNREMMVIAPLSYLENPFCGACFPERLAKRLEGFCGWEMTELERVRQDVLSLVVNYPTTAELRLAEFERLLTVEACAQIAKAADIFGDTFDMREAIVTKIRALLPQVRAEEKP